MPAASKQAKKKSADPSLSKQPRADLPDWPPLGFSSERSETQLREVLPGQIITVPGFWSPSLCRKYVSFLAGLPLVTTPGKPKKGEAVRVNDRYQVDDASFAERLWSETGLKDVVMSHGIDEALDQDQKQKVHYEHWGGTPCGLYSNIRVYRYSAGQYFDQHCEYNSLSQPFQADNDGSDDDSNLLSHPGPPSTPAKTTWTLLLYLTSPADGCVGGETVFYPDPAPAAGKKGKKDRVQPEPIVVGLETGMALLHKHGKDCLLHEGREVTQGEKWVIRSDLCVKR